MAVGTSEQLPTVASAWQLAPFPETVTSPVGVPDPGAFAVTENAKVTGSPNTEVSGESSVNWVVVLALFTWWVPWRNLRQRNIGWRLDYILASPAIAERAASCAVLSDVGTSDHAPVVMTAA